MSKMIDQIDDQRAYADKVAIGDGWYEFLRRYPFDVFFTQTFRDQAGSGQCAIARTKRVLDHWFDMRDRKKTYTAFIVAETHHLGGYHTHGLLILGAMGAEYTKELCSSLWALGLKMYGRCKFEPIDSLDLCRGYVSKYIVKQQADWLMIGGKLSDMANANATPTAPIGK